MKGVVCGGGGGGAGLGCWNVVLGGSVWVVLEFQSWLESLVVWCVGCGCCGCLGFEECLESRGLAWELVSAIGFLCDFLL